MRNKQSIKIQVDSEMDRLKDILFPKKSKKITTQTQPSQQQTPNPNRPIKHHGTFIKSEIEKLRSEIGRIMIKGQENQNIQEQETERVYLDGINKLSKELKDYSSQIADVFDQFVDHLPTNLSIDRKNYTNHYFLSKLVQNVVWSGVDNIFKKNVSHAFKAIQEEALQVKEFEETQHRIQKQREMKYKNKVQGQINKYFNIWRHKNFCINVEGKKEVFMRENCLQNDRKTLQNLNNLPVLVLMLEQICKNSCDYCEILLYDEKTNKYCKFFQESFDCQNSALETVTQRSILNGEISNKKFRRFQFESKTSITQLCLQRKEVISVPNIIKHPDYSDVDNNCISQSSHSYRIVGQNDGLILYPLFDSRGQLMGILRQYFSQSGSKYIPQEKLQKISILLDQSLTLERHARVLSKQRGYQKQSYYLKMINLVKKLQLDHPSKSNIFEHLEAELRNLFKINSCSVYRVQRSENDAKRMVLQCLWGVNTECQFLLSIFDQFMKQGTNHLYLENRLVIYSNMMLFDMKVEVQAGQKDEIMAEILPVQLFSNVMAKVEVILIQKQRQKVAILEGEQRIHQKQRKEKEEIFKKELEQISIRFISEIDKAINPFCQIKKFFGQVFNVKRKILDEKESENAKLSIFLELFQTKGRKENKTYYLSQTLKWEQTSEEIDEQAISIPINNTLNVLFICENIQIIFAEQISKTVSTFLKYFLHFNRKLQKEVKFNEQFSFWQPQTEDVHLIDSQNMRKEWELKYMTKLFNKFQGLVQHIADQYLQSSGSIQWRRDRPCDKNLEEWKNIVYQFALIDLQKIEVNISCNTPSFEMAQYQQNKIIFKEIGQMVEQQSEFSISIKSNLISKVVKEDNSSILLSIPVYFSSTDKNDANEYQLKIKSILSEVKRIWIKWCTSFIENVNSINSTIKANAAVKIMDTVSCSKNKVVKERWSVLKNFYILKKKQNKVIEKMFHIVELSVKRKKIVNMEQLKSCQNSSHHFIFSPKVDKILSSFATTLTRYIYEEAFENIIKPLRKAKSLQQMNGVLSRCLARQYKLAIQYSFDMLFYSSKQNRRNEYTINAISYILQKKMQYAFTQIKQTKQDLQQKAQNNYEKQFQKVKSVRQLSSVVQSIAPQYELYLAIDSLHCYSIYSSEKKRSIIKLEKVINASSEWAVYQIGSQSQLIWYYPFQTSQNSYATKDKLNNLSKCVEQAIKKCYEINKQSLTNIFLFKNKWINTLKSTYLKQWRNQSHSLGMLQKNRLNDCLYQISVESQTMKEKLKLQEKNLKNNHTIYKELQRKKEEYSHLIQFSEEQVKKIQDSYSKLQYARNLYSELHKRTVLKNIMLTWRNNAEEIKFNMIKTYPVNSLHKIATRSIISVLTPKIKRQLRNVLTIMGEFRNYFPKKLQVAKIKVNFDDYSDRLITFQSNIDEKQNSSRNSNRSSSPESRSMYRSVNKLKMSKMNEEKRLKDLSAEELNKYNNGIYKLNPKTLKFLKRMGKLQQ